MIKFDCPLFTYIYDSLIIIIFKQKKTSFMLTNLIVSTHPHVRRLYTSNGVYKAKVYRHYNETCSATVSRLFDFIP